VINCFFYFFTFIFVNLLLTLLPHIIILETAKLSAALLFKIIVLILGWSDRRAFSVRARSVR